MTRRLYLPALAGAALLFTLAGHGVEKAPPGTAGGSTAKPDPPDPAELAVGLRLNARESALVQDGYDALLREAITRRAAVRQLKAGHPQLARLKQGLQEYEADLAESKKRLVELEKERRKLERAAGQAAGPAPALIKAAERWEHGEVSLLRTPKTTARWVTARATVEADGWAGLATKLKAPEPAKGATEANHRLRVMDRLSADGWELTAHGKGGPEGAAVWSFRRRAK
jgi:hypothetical protein